MRRKNLMKFVTSLKPIRSAIRLTCSSVSARRRMASSRMRLSTTAFMLIPSTVWHERASVLWDTASRRLNSATGKRRPNVSFRSRCRRCTSRIAGTGAPGDPAARSEDNRSSSASMRWLNAAPSHEPRGPSSRRSAATHPSTLKISAIRAGGRWTFRDHSSTASQSRSFPAGACAISNLIVWG